ncbi:lipid II flippase MurJ [Pajaroellobacter abortibovis]|nr:lipid II flippase MurJ [Pajaroellobacter abortibovis]
MTRSSVGHIVLRLLPLQLLLRGWEAILPLLFAIWFGHSAQMDIYYFSFSLFTFVGSFISYAYTDSVIIPILTNLRCSEPQHLRQMIASLFTYTLVLAVALGLVIGLIAFGWFSLRYTLDSFSFAARMILPLFLYLLFLSLKSFLIAVLNAEHHYVLPPLAGGFGTVVNLACLFLLKSGIGVLAIPIASALGELVALLVVMWAVAIYCNSPLFISFERPQAMIQFSKLAFFEVSGSTITRINPVVDQLMANLTMVVGGGALLRYAGDVALVPTSLLQATLLPVLLSHLSEHVAHKDYHQVKKMTYSSLSIVFVGLAVLSGVIYLMRIPLLRFLFLRGVMEGEGVDQMAQLLGFFLLGLAPFGVMLVLARVHSALQNSQLLFKAGFLSALTNLLLDFLCVHQWGLKGVALATAGVYWVLACFLGVALFLSFRQFPKSAQ